jgi:hypothetical protein
MASAQQVLMAGGYVLLPSSLQASASGTSFSGPANAIVSLTLKTDGSLILNSSAIGNVRVPVTSETKSYTWIVGGDTGQLSARMRLLAGIFDGSANTDEWVPITSDLVWFIGSFSSSQFGEPESDSVSAVLEIAFNNNLTSILAQCNINFETDATFVG